MRGAHGNHHLRLHLNALTFWLLPESSLSLTILIVGRHVDDPSSRLGGRKGKAGHQPHSPSIELRARSSCPFKSHIGSFGDRHVHNQSSRLDQRMKRPAKAVQMFQNRLDLYLLSIPNSHSPDRPVQSLYHENSQATWIRNHREASKNSKHMH